jgi:hypothetical protein
MTAAGATVSLPTNATTVLHKPIGIIDLITVVKRFC